MASAKSLVATKLRNAQSQSLSPGWLQVALDDGRARDLRLVDVNLDVKVRLDIIAESGVDGGRPRQTIYTMY